LGSSSPHRVILRTAALIFIFIGAMTFLNLLVVPLVPHHPAIDAVGYIEQAIFALAVVGAGALLYSVAPNVMD
jgi:hypothetical protein